MSWQLGAQVITKLKPKKNAVIAGRIDSNWRLKTDTKGLSVEVGSQTGRVIRQMVKDELRKAGYRQIIGLKINIVTDGVAAFRSAL